ncbi:S1 family peptidase [Streptomyces sp. DHE17-7]|uniref:S1 family peptidase n=1 Tax=Streptomyces sp. DHE17-7 TaxID=2759949 RepID=UPI002FCE0F84
MRPSVARALVAAAGVDASAVRVEKAAEKPRPLYDLRGGEAYYINNSGRCSIGFPVTKGSQEGFATAGHCGRTGASTTGYNDCEGTFQGVDFRARDMAGMMWRVNGRWRAPVQSAPGGQNVQVTGSTQAPVGASVCRSGSTTG